MNPFRERAFQMSPARLPDIFIVGAQKAGTTSLYHWLAQHPAIRGMPHTKDLPFFADEKLFAQGIDYFTQIFSGTSDNQLIMSGSVHYLFFPIALERIRAHCPDAKILVTLREPLARSISAYRFAVQRGLESRSFDEAVRDELSAPTLDELYTTKVDRFQKYYVARSLYGEQLRRLYGLFPEKQIFVGLFCDMVRDEEKFFERVLEFLELPPFRVQARRRNVTMGMPRSKWLSQLLFHDGLLGSHAVQLLKRVIPLHHRYHIRRFVLALNTNKQRDADCEMSESTRQQLRALYLKDLRQWGTPEANRWIRIWDLEPHSALQEVSK